MLSKTNEILENQKFTFKTLYVDLYGKAKHHEK